MTLMYVSPQKEEWTLKRKFEPFQLPLGFKNMSTSSKAASCLWHDTFSLFERSGTGRLSICGWARPHCATQHGAGIDEQDQTAPGTGNNSAAGGSSCVWGTSRCWEKQLRKKPHWDQATLQHLRAELVPLSSSLSTEDVPAQSLCSSWQHMRPNCTLTTYLLKLVPQCSKINSVKTAVYLEEVLQ